MRAKMIGRWLELEAKARNPITALSRIDVTAQTLNRLFIEGAS